MTDSLFVLFAFLDNSGLSINCMNWLFALVLIAFIAHSTVLCAMGLCRHIHPKRKHRVMLFALVFIALITIMSHGMAQVFPLAAAAPSNKPSNMAVASGLYHQIYWPGMEFGVTRADIQWLEGQTGLGNGSPNGFPHLAHSSRIVCA